MPLGHFTPPLATYVWQIGLATQRLRLCHCYITVEYLTWPDLTWPDRTGPDRTPYRGGFSQMFYFWQEFTEMPSGIPRHTTFRCTSFDYIGDTMPWERFMYSPIEAHFKHSQHFYCIIAFLSRDNDTIPTALFTFSGSGNPYTLF